MHYKQCLVVFDYIYAVQFDWIVEMLCCFTPFCFTSSHFLRLKAHSCVFYKVKSFMNINISYVNETFSLWTTRNFGYYLLYSNFIFANYNQIKQTSHVFK